jgi:hypothetical protein
MSRKQLPQQHLVAHEYDRGYAAGERGDEPHEPADCVCRDSWLAGYHYGRAVRSLRMKAK